MYKVGRGQVVAHLHDSYVTIMLMMMMRRRRRKLPVLIFNLINP
jgi:hypothetical protein